MASLLRLGFLEVVLIQIVLTRTIFKPPCTKRPNLSAGRRLQLEQLVQLGVVVPQRTQDGLRRSQEQLHVLRPVVALRRHTPRQRSHATGGLWITTCPDDELDGLPWGPPDPTRH